MKLKYLLLLFLLLSGALFAETKHPSGIAFPRWGALQKGASVYDFETDMDGGGSFSVNRYFMEAGIVRMWRMDRMLSLSAGFGQDDYNFGGLGSDPWNNIDNYRLGMFARWGLDEKWVLFAGPSIRAYGESGSDLADGLTAAFFGGASYKFSDRLVIGPALGVFGQLDDDVRYFPSVIVNWGITESLSLETGGGLAATVGPGLSLTYTISKHWKAGVTGRYEKKRFRLDGSGTAANGVGEDENIPIFGSIAYDFYPGGRVGVIFGCNMSGKLSVDNQYGGMLYDIDYDSAFSFGGVASFRF